MKLNFFVGFFFLLPFFCGNYFYFPNVSWENTEEKDKEILVGASRTEAYLPLLKEKTVALLVNQTSMVDTTHLVDTLLKFGIKIKYIFSPEHGFRGQSDAGELVQDSKDVKTGISLISLYGSKKKPSSQDLKGIDWVIFDIQDVGARFYTYLHTMHDVMEACAENDVKFLVLDRPNPNGHYIDGPILDLSLKSPVGRHPVPIVHGMTPGEYAQMINGEGWLKNGKQCELKVISCLNYDHKDSYSLPVKPSPNLPNDRSISLYPSICLFEGTTASLGRGTNKQFQIYGHPDYTEGEFMFVPQSMPGAKYPPHKGKTCSGYDLSTLNVEKIWKARQINLEYIISFYEAFPNKEKFFLKNGFFDLLAGNKSLRQQIVAGKSAKEIRKGWKKGLKKYQATRKKYLLYKDF